MAGLDLEMLPRWSSTATDSASSTDAKISSNCSRESTWLLIGLKTNTSSVGFSLRYSCMETPISTLQLRLPLPTQRHLFLSAENMASTKITLSSFKVWRQKKSCWRRLTKLVVRRVYTGSSWPRISTLSQLASSRKEYWPTQWSSFVIPLELFIKSKSISYTLKEKLRNDHRIWFKSLKFENKLFLFFECLIILW